MTRAFALSGNQVVAMIVTPRPNLVPKFLGHLKPVHVKPAHKHRMPGKLVLPILPILAILASRRVPHQEGPGGDQLHAVWNEATFFDQNRSVEPAWVVSPCRVGEGIGAALIERVC